MDINGISITIGSLFAIIGIALTVLNYIKNSKQDVQGKASDYALYKQRVQTLEHDLAETKVELKELRKEVMSEIRKIDTQILAKVDKINDKIDKLQTAIYEHLGKK